MPMNKDTKTIRQVALMTGISESLLRKLTKTGEIPHQLTKNGEIRLSISSIASILDAQQKQTICLIPAAAADTATKQAESWLAKRDHKINTIVYFETTQTFDEILIAINKIGSYARIVVFCSHLLSRDVAAGMIIETSKRRADMHFVNSTSLT